MACVTLELSSQGLYTSCKNAPSLRLRRELHVVRLTQTGSHVYVLNFFYPSLREGYVGGVAAAVAIAAASAAAGAGAGSGVLYLLLGWDCAHLSWGDLMNQVGLMHIVL
ncbi:hypothetical protein B484DRAFT_407851 [Ochromonadaceae sp. CCMP2298]|nr:hypothetical protein B484DRAFT_407851 [Ochromonadaceae sp. CCMP2298]